MKIFLSVLSVCLMCLICGKSYAIQEDFVRIKEISDSVIKDCKTDEDKVIALSHFVHTKLQPDESKIPANAVMSTVDRLDAGVGFCNHQVAVFMRLCEAQKIKTRMLYLLNKEGTSSPHTIGEAWVNSRWVIVDPIFDLNIRNASGELISLRDVYKDVNILKGCPALKARGDVDKFIDNFLNPMMFVYGLE